MFTTRFQAWVRRHAQRLGRLLGRLPITPNQVTVAGVLATFAAALLVGLGHLGWGALVLAGAGTFDIFDGALARATKRTYTYGAFLDSTTDRYAEVAVYIGIAAHFLDVRDPAMKYQVLGCLVAMAGSLLVSYTRARAQSLGFTCDGGLFARPERVVVTVAGLLLDPLLPGLHVLQWVVFGLALLTNLTALQRINEVWGQARARRRARESGSPAPAGGETTGS